MNNISPLACVSKKAILGDNIEIGPFAFVDDENVSARVFAYLFSVPCTDFIPGIPAVSTFIYM